MLVIYLRGLQWLLKITFRRDAIGTLERRLLQQSAVFGLSEEGELAEEVVADADGGSESDEELAREAHSGRLAFEISNIDSYKIAVIATTLFSRRLHLLL